MLTVSAEIRRQDKQFPSLLVGTCRSVDRFVPLRSFTASTNSSHSFAMYQGPPRPPTILPVHAVYYVNPSAVPICRPGLALSEQSDGRRSLSDHSWLMVLGHSTSSPDKMPRVCATVAEKSAGTRCKSSSHLPFLQIVPTAAFLFLLQNWLHVSPDFYCYFRAYLVGLSYRIVCSCLFYRRCCLK